MQADCGTKSLIRASSYNLVTCATLRASILTTILLVREISSRHILETRISIEKILRLAKLVKKYLRNAAVAFVSTGTYQITAVSEALNFCFFVFCSHLYSTSQL